VPVDVGASGLAVRPRLRATSLCGQVAGISTGKPSYTLFGVLVEKRFGHARLFVNGENLGNVKQTDWDLLLRPARGCRWPLDRCRGGAAGRPQYQRRRAPAVLNRLTVASRNCSSLVMASHRLTREARFARSVR
jgi:hypothetical protein